MAMLLSMVKKLGTRFFTINGKSSGCGCHSSSDLRQSKSCTSEVNLGGISLQVSGLSNHLEDLIWVVATLSCQVESLTRRVSELEELLRDLTSDKTF